MNLQVVARDKGRHSRFAGAIWRDDATLCNPTEIPMLRLLSIAALASAAIIAAIPNSPASAAGVTINSVGVGARVGVGRQFAPTTRVINMQNQHHLLKARRWVCGPIVNWDGTPHCHWVS